MSNTNALLVIAKRPTPGQTKTRLTPPLTAEQAAALYECFLVDTLDLVRRVPETDPLIAYLPIGSAGVLCGAGARLRAGAAGRRRFG